MSKFTSSQFDELTSGNQGMPRVGSSLSILSLRSRKADDKHPRHATPSCPNQNYDSLSMRRGYSSQTQCGISQEAESTRLHEPTGILSSPSSSSFQSHHTHKSFFKSPTYNEEVNQQHEEQGDPVPQTCWQRFRYGFLSNSLVLFLVIGIVAVSAWDWVQWKKTLNRFHSHTGDVSYSFFVLQVYISSMLCLAAISTFICMYVLKIIDEKQRKFPQRIFMTQSSFDACTQLLSSTSSPIVAGHIQTLLNQGMLPLIMFFSFIMLKTRYNLGQYAGAALILAGTLLAAIPSVSATDASGRETKTYGVILYSLSAVPFAFGNTYGEYIFRKTGVRSVDEKQPEEKPSERSQINDSRQDQGPYGALDDLESPKSRTLAPSEENRAFYPSSASSVSINHQAFDTTDIDSSSQQQPSQQPQVSAQPSEEQEEPLPKLNIFYLMFWTSLYQLLFTILMFPLLNLSIFGGVPFSEIPNQFVNGGRCLVGLPVPELECEKGMIPGVSLLIYVLLNWIVSQMRINLVRYGSALMLQITNALALLFSNILFSFEPIMGDQTEKFNIYDVFGLCLVIIGFMTFRLSLLYKDGGFGFCQKKQEADDEAMLLLLSPESEDSTLPSSSSSVPQTRAPHIELSSSSISSAHKRR